MKPLIQLTLCSLLISGWTLQARASEAASVRIINKSFDPATSELSYEISNGSKKMVTAWRLSLARGDTLGQLQRSHLDQDTYMGLLDKARANTQDEVVFEGPIQPGQRLAAKHQLDIVAEGSELEALSLKVVAVVFADTTFQGDPDGARTILEARAARVDEIGRILGRLRKTTHRDRSLAGPRTQTAVLADELAREAKIEPTEGLRPEVASQLSVTRAELAESLAKTAELSAFDSVRGAAALDRLIGHLERSYELGLRHLPRGK